MAKTKNASSTDVSEKPVFDISAYLPAGMDESELVRVGGLRPIAAAELSFEEGTPVAGYIVGILDMPPRLSMDREKRARGEKEPWEAIVIELTAPTMALVGEDRQSVPAGKEVIIPVNANLKNNRELTLAAFDPKSVFWGLFRVAGQVELGSGRNAMWDYEVFLHPKTKERTGAYRLTQRRPDPVALNGPMAGQVVDSSGRTVSNLVG